MSQGVFKQTAQHCSRKLRRVMWDTLCCVVCVDRDKVRGKMIFVCYLESVHKPAFAKTHCHEYMCMHKFIYIHTHIHVWEHTRGLQNIQGTHSLFAFQIVMHREWFILGQGYIENSRLLIFSSNASATSRESWSPLRGKRSLWLEPSLIPAWLWWRRS